jgi:hypothetical protein
VTDLIARAESFLQLCGTCDGGLPMACTCPTGDYRAVMLDLVREVERLRTVAWKLHDAMTGEHDKSSHFLDIEDCQSCVKARDEGDPEYACAEYKAWQRTYTDALGCVIGAHPEQTSTATCPNPSDGAR